jgi:hypothetical protein
MTIERSPVLDKQPMDGGLERRLPMRSTTAKRALVSILLSMPAAMVAYVISNTISSPDWLRFAISPGFLMGVFAIRREACRGFFDCLISITASVGTAGVVTWAVNVIVYGLLIFAIISTFSPTKLSEK